MGVSRMANSTADGMLDQKRDANCVNKLLYTSR